MNRDRTTLLLVVTGLILVVAALVAGWFGAYMDVPGTQPNGTACPGLAAVWAQRDLAAQVCRDAASVRARQVGIICGALAGVGVVVAVPGRVRMGRRTRQG